MFRRQLVSSPPLDVSDPPIYFTATHRAIPVMFHQVAMNFIPCIAFFAEKLNDAVLCNHVNL
jgi:hypothetical protein